MKDLDKPTVDPVLLQLFRPSVIRGPCPISLAWCYLKPTHKQDNEFQEFVWLCDDWPVFCKKRCFTRKKCESRPCKLIQVFDLNNCQIWYLFSIFWGLERWWNIINEFQIVSIFSNMVAFLFILFKTDKIASLLYLHTIYIRTVSSKPQ